MKILVTGGAGFIGSNFVHYWLKRHPTDSLVVFDKLTYAGNLENLAPVKEKITFVKGDICDADAVAKVMTGVEAVVHFAAESHVDRSIQDPEAFIKTNILGTHVLLQAALEQKVIRFHHVSTDEVFGQIQLTSDEKWTETSPYNPRSPYSASKAGSDHLVRAYYATYGLPVTITNCSNNFGPYQFPEKFIPLAVTNLLEGKKIPVYTPGNQIRDWLYVEDHCRAIDLVLENGQIGQTYLVGSQHREFTNLEVAHMIANLLGFGVDQIELVGDRPGHDAKYAIDAGKIKRELGWEPQSDFETYLKATIKWYKDNQAWWKNIKSGEYQKYYERQYTKR